MFSKLLSICFSGDDWEHSFKIIVNYEDDYLKHHMYTKPCCFLVPKGLTLSKPHSTVIVYNSPDYVHVSKSVTNGFWHSILKTMLLSEAWPDEFQLCIIRKRINHNSWNIYDNSHTFQNMLAAFHCFRVLFFSGTHCIAFRAKHRKFIVRRSQIKLRLSWLR